jgi:hypothetical protein
MDGSLAGEIKDFLIKQERCKEVKIDSITYPGIFSFPSNEESNKNEL